jgi:inner membrane protein
MATRFTTASSEPWSLSLDNLTHALVGAVISKGGAERTTPLATATLVISANAPDIDVLSYLKGEYFALSFRRGLTHGLPALMVLPFVVTAAILAWDRWVRRRRNPSVEPVRPLMLLGLSAVGMVTHPVLDWMNTYGMRWGLPFRDGWSYGDALFIIDPWIWLVLGGALFISSNLDRRTVESWSLVTALTTILIWMGVGGLTFVVWLIGLGTIVGLRASMTPIAPRRRRTIVTSAASATVLYILLMLGTGSHAEFEATQAARDQGFSVREVMAAPTAGNPFARDVEVRTTDSFVPGRHDWFSSPRVQLRPDEAVPLIAFPGSLLPGIAEELHARARGRAEVRNYLKWSRYPYVHITSDSTGWTVRFSDAQYDSRPESGGLAGLSVHLSSMDTP